VARPQTRILLPPFSLETGPPAPSQLVSGSANGDLTFFLALHDAPQAASSARLRTLKKADLLFPLPPHPMTLLFFPRWFLFFFKEEEFSLGFSGQHPSINRFSLPFRFARGTSLFRSIDRPVSTRKISWQELCVSRFGFSGV